MGVREKGIPVLRNGTDTVLTSPVRVGSADRSAFSVGLVAGYQ
jgi:hypothetical protein